MNILSQHGRNSGRESCRFYMLKCRKFDQLALQPGMINAQLLDMQRNFFKKSIALALLLTFTGIGAHAALGNYDLIWPQQFEQYFKYVDAKAESLPPQTINQCNQHYAAIAEKGTLDFRYALGYFDESHGYSSPQYGFSPSIDGSNFSALREFLTKPCAADSKRMSCGFAETGLPQTGVTQLSKSITLLGRPVNVTITLTHSSASELFDNNVGPLIQRQETLTAQSEDNFFDGLSSADIVFYNGHSRNGGGPDFKPPVLNAHKKADYSGYYQIKREGFKHMMTSLKQQHAPALVGIFSCFSKKHFHATMMKNNPRQSVILTGDAIDYLSTTQASLGYLEAILRGECGARLDEIAKQSPHIQKHFFDYNFK